MRAYKFLGAGRIAPFTGFAWPERAWVDTGADPTACRSGVHACRAEQLPYWLGEELWEVELGGEVVEEGRKLVARSGRLFRRVDDWPQIAAALAADCVARCGELAAADPALAGYVADAELYAERGDVACTAYIAAHAAGRATGADGLVSERARQAAWIAARLDRP